MRGRVLGVALGALCFAAASPARGQVCNGLPFRGNGMVAARYVSGDAADRPYTIRALGAVVVRQLPGWDPVGGHHAVSFNASGANATWMDARALPGAPRLAGRGASGGAVYTADLLPGSYGGAYTLCLSGGVQGQWWQVDRLSSRGVTVPLFLSFGVPLGSARFGVLPHASFGAYGRVLAGSSPEGSVRTRGLRPWSEAGVGFYAGHVRTDAGLEHEFRSAARVLLTLGLEP